MTSPPRRSPPCTPPSAPGRTPARLATLLLAALLVAACSGSAGGIKASGAWSRASAAVAGAGAAYLVVENSGSAADFLTGGTTDVAKTVEVHETVDMSSAMPAPSMPASSMETGGGMASPAASGGMASGGAVMGMQRIERLEIPAGGKVELKPGSYHLMLIDLTRQLVVGETIEITLHFEKAGDVKVAAEVRAG